MSPAISLYAHQEEAVRRSLADPRHALLLDTGTGKTLTALTILERSGDVPAVVLAPLSVVRSSWLSDARHTPSLRVAAGTGVRSSRRVLAEELFGRRLDVLVLSYETFRVDYAAVWRPAFERGQLTSLILDESTRVKSPTAKISRQVRHCSRYVTRCHIMSGCFAPNSLMEAWGQIYCVDPALLGRTYIGFRHKYFYQPRPEKLRWLWSPQPATMCPPDGAEALIQRTIAPRAYVCEKHECLDLPPQTFEERLLELSTKERKVYDAFLKHLVASIGDRDVVGATALSEVMHLRTFTAGLAHLRAEGGYSDEWVPIGDTKLHALSEVSEEVGRSRGLLVLGQFRRELERAKGWLEGKCQRRTGLIYGGTPERRRQGIIEAFNGGGLDALVGHPAAMGHGLNLQHRCSDTVWLSLDYSYERFKQACDRVHRNLQRWPVTHHLLLAGGTIDERIWRCLQGKRDATASILEELR